MSEYPGMGFPMTVGIVVVSAAQLASVYALLGGASSGAIARGSTAAESRREPAPEPVREALAGDAGNAGAAAPVAAAGDPNEIDAAGWPWSADLHASTKGKTKEGLWRMKVGVSRPDPKPGFPVAGSGTGTGSAGTNGGSAAASAAPASATVDEDDEFAAFAAASQKVQGEDAAAAAGVAARKWTDADLGALCNQAAIKLGDPAPVREIIQKYVAADATAHSRNIPDDKREAFASEVETKADIKFAG